MMNLSIDHRQGKIPPCQSIYFFKIRAVDSANRDLMSSRPIVCICARDECILLFRDRRAHVSRCFWTFSSQPLSLKRRESKNLFHRLYHADTYTPQWRGAVGLWNRFLCCSAINHLYLNCGFSNVFSFKPSACFLRRIAAFSLCSVRSF